MNVATSSSTRRTTAPTATPIPAASGNASRVMRIRCGVNGTDFRQSRYQYPAMKIQLTIPAPTKPISSMPHPYISKMTTTAIR